MKQSNNGAVLRTGEIQSLPTLQWRYLGPQYPLLHATEEALRNRGSSVGVGVNLILQVKVLL